MMAADSLRSGVPSGMSFRWLLPCRRACSAGAFAPHLALPSNVQASCLERCRPVAVGAFAGALAARAAAPLGRRCLERQRKARQKDAAPGRVESLSARGGGAARSGFAAVPRGARGPRQ